jgi:mRNA interferase MazF
MPPQASGKRRRRVLKAGDVVVADFPGVTGIKRRPAIVVSTDLYHSHRPDVIVSLLTTQIAAATAPTDYVLKDWAAAGLHRPSAARSFLVTLPAAGIVVTGRLTDRHWQEGQARLKSALAIL